MADKKKWTVIDTIIVILVVTAAAAAYMMLGGKGNSGKDAKAEIVIMISNQVPELAEAMHEGDNITLSLTEKDSGVLKSVRTETAQAMAYNSIDGTYSNEEIEGKVDIYATVEVDCNITDYAITVGSTVLKVGTDTPFRGKGYATQGYVIEINE